MPSKKKMQRPLFVLMIVKSQRYVRDVVAYLAGALKQPALFNGLVD